MAPRAPWRETASVRVRCVTRSRCDERVWGAEGFQSFLLFVVVARLCFRSASCRAALREIAR
eukprot:10901838-Lingulodinium_polyedra.AAC.1